MHYNFVAAFALEPKGKHVMLHLFDALCTLYNAFLLSSDSKR